jgi:hypothetical protein
MLRAGALVLLLVLAPGAARAAQCTSAVESRWNAAMREDARGAQIVEREAKKGAKASKDAICNVLRTVPNLLKAARDYYEACDPGEAQAAIAPIQAHAEQAAAFYEANCRAKRGPAPAAR